MSEMNFIAPACMICKKQIDLKYYCCKECVERPQWIKLSDQKPEKDGRYLVYVPYSSHWWIGVSSLRNGEFDDTTATMWMPLPASPKKEGKI